MKGHMKIQIKVNAPAYAGALVPAFNAKRINESELGGTDLRFKEYGAWLDVVAKEGNVDWLAQETNSPNDDFDHELVCVFVANGARPGTTIHLRFGRHSDGYKVNYDINQNKRKTT